MFPPPSCAQRRLRLGEAPALGLQFDLKECDARFAITGRTSHGDPVQALGLHRMAQRRFGLRQHAPGAPLQWFGAE